MTMDAESAPAGAPKPPLLVTMRVTQIAGAWIVGSLLLVCVTPVWILSTLILGEIGLVLSVPLLVVVAAGVLAGVARSTADASPMTATPGRCIGWGILVVIAGVGCWIAAGGTYSTQLGPLHPPAAVTAVVAGVPFALAAALLVGGRTSVVAVVVAIALVVAVVVAVRLTSGYGSEGRASASGDAGTGRPVPALPGVQPAAGGVQPAGMRAMRTRCGWSPTGTEVIFCPVAKSMAVTRSAPLSEMTQARPSPLTVAQ